MEKEIKILTAWLIEAESTFKEKYSAIREHTGPKTNMEIIEYNAAMETLDFIKTWKRKLSKMQGGKKMPARVITKINNLPDLKTTHPNRLRG